MKAVKGEACNPSLECPLFPNCYEDRHHKIGQKLLRWALGDLKAGLITDEQYQIAKTYVRHPMNIIVGCRWVHATELDKTVPNALPPFNEMQDFNEANPY